MNGRLRPFIWLALGLLLVVLPPYAFERLAQYYYLIHSHVFGTLSGSRYYFDVAYLPLAAGVLGYRFRDYTFALATYLLSVVVFVSLLFSFCQPILCYSPGIDGFEPLRMGAFFAAEGVAAAYLGGLGRNRRPVSLWQGLLSWACAFYAIAYNASIFTLAGARILSPLDPYAALLFFGVLSLVVVAKEPQEIGAAVRIAIPVASQGILLLIGVGIAQQYFPEVLPFIVWSMVATVIGAVLGSALLRSRNRVGSFLKRSRLPVVGIILFVLLTTVVIWPDAVAGQVVAASSVGEPGDYSFAIPMYVGGFMSSPMVRPTAVALNVSFSGTDATSIAASNFLAAGIGVHSADCCTDGIDYGYRFDLQLWRNGSENLVADAWKICDANAACGGHSWKVLLYHNSVPYGNVSQERPVRLVLLWENHTVVWAYGSGSNLRVIGTLEGSSRMNAAFNAGWLGPPDRPSPGGAFFFQFGVTTLSALNGRWSAAIECPAIMLNQSWACVDHAQSIQGDQSFWKVLWRWGEAFPGVGVTVNQEEQSVSFHNSTSTIQSFVNLW